LKQSRLIATTALVATAGIANAEVAVSGAAKAGLVYNSEGGEKTRLLSSATVIFDATGETDGGMTFGFNANIIVTNNGSVDNDDTTVYMSGAFGKLSFGAVAEADEQAGLSDIGWDGLDVDDIAEAFVGDELGDFLDTFNATGRSGSISLGHNVNYTYVAGPLTLSLSGQLPTSNSVDNVDSYAAGMKYSFGDFYAGLGYADHSVLASNLGLSGGNPSGPTQIDANVTSLFGGGSFGAIKVAALYSDLNVKIDGTKGSGDAYGMNVSYTMDALTVSLGAGRSEIKGLGKQSSLGLGAAYNLGGGASISGGIARIKDDSFSSAFADENDFGTSETRADIGVKFSF